MYYADRALVTVQFKLAFWVSRSISLVNELITKLEITTQLSQAVPDKRTWHKR